VSHSSLPRRGHTVSHSSLPRRGHTRVTQLTTKTRPHTCHTAHYQDVATHVTQLTTKTWPHTCHTAHYQAPSLQCVSLVEKHRNVLYWKLLVQNMNITCNVQNVGHCATGFVNTAVWKALLSQRRGILTVFTF